MAREDEKSSSSFILLEVVSYQLLIVNGKLSDVSYVRNLILKLSHCVTELLNHLKGEPIFPE